MVSIILNFIFSASVFAASAAPCAQVKALKIPSGDYANANQLASLEGKTTSCFIFHHGLGVPKDDEKYRHCLLAPSGKVSDSPGEALRNWDLADLYANGWGVKSNKKLALALICQTTLAKDELDSIAEDLTVASEGEFHTCAYGEGHFMTSICAGESFEIQKAKLENTYSRQRSNWNDETIKAMDKLRVSAEKFGSIDADFITEVTVGSAGTLASSVRTGIAEHRMKDFESALEAMESPLPKSTEKDERKAERELNASYQRVLKKIHKENTGLARKAERAWLTLRDDWIAAYRARYRSTSLPSELDRLVRIRTARERAGSLDDVIAEH